MCWVTVKVGLIVGRLNTLGTSVGNSVGPKVLGLTEGNTLGESEGTTLGISEGDSLGAAVVGGSVRIVG